jgi:hypothetical protein
MKNNKSQPDNPHQLPSNNRIAAVCTNAEVKVDLHVFAFLNITYGHYSLVKINRLNFVVEKEFDISAVQGFVEETLV